MLFYKVGHWQFQLFLYVGALYVWSTAELSPSVRRAVIAYCAWMSLSAILYLACHQYFGVFWALRWIGAFPATAAVVWLLVGLYQLAASYAGAVEPQPIENGRGLQPSAASRDASSA
jgi:hypothetical protein